MPINNVCLTGRLVADVEARQTKSGETWCTFTLAVPAGSKEAPPHFIDCKAYKQAAEFISKWGKKGERVGVTGSLNQDRWEKDGQKHSRIAVSVFNIEKYDWAEKSDAVTTTSDPF